MSVLPGFLLVLQLVVVLQALPPGHGDGGRGEENLLQENWELYKMKHGKQYSSNDEEEHRRAIWLNNVNIVTQHNMEQHSYTMAINQFSDWTSEEFNNYLGYKLQDTEQVEYKTFQEKETPVKIDYREEGLVTEVKDQGMCGSCWAFSAMGSMEGAWAKNNTLVRLSEQEMIDCGEGSCQGGWMDEAFKTAIKMGGIMSEEDYPYQHNSHHECRYQSEKAAAKITGYQDVTPGEPQLELALAEAGHPVSVAIHAGFKLQLYHSGIFHDSTCKLLQLNHGVLLVGYDKTDPDNAYWIVKNSWGPGWGMDGYVHMKMGQNICGISKQPSYATL